MAVEPELGISVSSAVKSFEQTRKTFDVCEARQHAFNLLDTGVTGISARATFWTLSAVDSLLDGSRRRRRQRSVV
jgi:peptide subunit release factor RF-3